MFANPEAIAWQQADIDDLWLFDKLILSRKLGYICGGVGVDVPKPGNYIVRPCVNLLGLGHSTRIEHIKLSTNHLPPGHFWCEIFEGKHLSIDYQWGKQKLAVQGFKPEETFIFWDKWIVVNDEVQFPTILKDFKHEWINCEFIGGNLIEAHLRKNRAFSHDNTEFIAVWEGQDTTPPEGYRYIVCPNHPRIGAFVK